MADNWTKTAPLKEWSLYEEDGDLLGVEYDTRIKSGQDKGVGKIDLLACKPTKGKWLVVELKKGQTSDQSVGQILRYMGWVQENLAKEDETVEGLIIARSADERIRLALKHTRNVDRLLYEVNFQLN